MIINAAPGSGKTEFVRQFITFDVAFKWDAEEKNFVPCETWDTDKTTIVFPVSRRPMGDFVDFDFGIFQKTVHETLGLAIDDEIIVDYYCSIIDGLHEVGAGLNFFTNLLSPKIAKLIEKHGGFLVFTATCMQESAKKGFEYDVNDWLVFAKRWGITYEVLPQYISHPESVFVIGNRILRESLNRPAEGDCADYELDPSDPDNGKSKSEPFFLHMDRMEVYSDTRTPRTLYMIPEFETDKYHCFVEEGKIVVEVDHTLSEIVSDDHYLRDVPSSYDKDHVDRIIGMISRCSPSKYEFVTRSCAQCKCCDK